MFAGIDANVGRNVSAKRLAIQYGAVQSLSVCRQARNPDFRITVHAGSDAALLSELADSFVGLQNGDTPRWLQHFWEQGSIGVSWNKFQMPAEDTALYTGRDSIVRWEGGNGDLARSPQARVQGLEAWDKPGVSIRLMGRLSCSLYSGDIYDQASAVIIPKNPVHLPAIWEFCQSPEFTTEVRKIDQKLNLTNATLVKVPFDLDHWTGVAANRHRNGLPRPYSDDPTQWLFHGHPAQAESGTELHVILARLAGYRWPAESDPDMRLTPEARAWIARAAFLPAADGDGVLCLPPVAGARPLADRLREYLNVAIPGWDEARLVREADERFDKKPGRDLSLEAWLRDRAFRQHCALFHNRPFLWQVWDGQRDGFSAFLHYHRLDTGALRKLTYTVLGDWKRRVEAEPRLAEAAAIFGRKLELILDGEAPHDVFVRWKALASQPLGWDPDLDDGVRLNIRPWVEAGVLREPLPKGLKWGIDRGADVASAPWFNLDKGKRNNDRHITLAEKSAARAAGAVTAAE